MNGKKFDGDKPRMELLPGKALEEVSKVLAEGAKKYGDYNWAKGMDYSRLIGAAYRHLTAFNNGEDLDLETGLSHLAHLSCCSLFLLEYVQRGLGNDNRHFKIEVEKSINEDHERTIANHLGYLYNPPVFRLETGKKYLSREMNVVTVHEFFHGPLGESYFECSDGIRRNIGGRVGYNDGIGCEKDLIQAV